MEDLQSVFAQTGELLSDKKLNDKSLLVQPVQVAAGKAYPVNAGGVTFSIGANSNLSVQLFNDEEDIDSDGFLSTKDADINFNTETDAYLKYAIIVNAKANAQGQSTSDIGFNFSVSADLLLKSLFYKKHSNTDTIQDDFLYDASHFKTIFRFEDVEQLELNDALCFKATTQLSSNISISWSNILSQSLSLLAKKLPTPVTLDIQLSPSFSATFNLNVTDDFNYFIKKISADTCLVKISKAKNTKAGLAAGFAISAGFADPAKSAEQLNILFDAVAKSLTGYNRADAENAIDKVQNAANALTDTEKQVIDTLAGIFKLNAVTGLPGKIAAAWQALKEDITKTIEVIATAHIEASFTYEYSLIKENKEFLSVNIPTAALHTYHSGLLRFNTNDIINAIRNNAQGIQLNAYLNQKTVDIKRTWGFGLKIFGVQLLGKDFSNYNVATRSDINGNSQVVADYSKGYNWQLGKGKGTWMGEFMCHMPTYSKFTTATLNEFDYALQLTTALTDPHISGKDFREYLDTAVLTGAIQQDDTDKLFHQYIDTIADKPVTVQTQVIFNENVFHRIVLQLGNNGWNNDTITRFAAALAAAMKFMPEYSLRSTVQKRISTYTNLWKNFITGNLSDDPGEVSAIVSATIENMHDHDHLAAFEGSGWSTSNDTFSGIVHIHPGLTDAVRSFIKGISNLAEGIIAGKNYDTKKFNKDIYNNISPLFTQSIYVRALSYFLVQYAAGAGLQDEVVKVFTITYGSGGDEQVINFAF